MNLTSGGADSIQVRLALLPSKRQKFKTKIRPAEDLNFNEEFFFKNISAVDVRRLVKKKLFMVNLQIKTISEFISF